MNSSIARFSLFLFATTLFTACATPYHPQHEHSHFTPGLGEIMAQTAVRHAKLWYAGQAQNWDLAAYEVDELHEGFEDAAKFHPTHKQIQQPIPALITQHMDQPLKDLEKAIKTKNLPAFNQHFDELTVGCNACHQVSAFGFNRVTRPTHNPFSNQAFEIR